jgi:hypothetical protein
MNVILTHTFNIVFPQDRNGDLINIQRRFERLEHPEVRGNKFTRTYRATAKGKIAVDVVWYDQKLG